MKIIKFILLGAVGVILLLFGSFFALLYFDTRLPSPPPETEAAIEQLRSTNSCERCVFSFADLSGADLTNAKLAGSYFLGSDLSGADLTGADLSFATFTYKHKPEWFDYRHVVLTDLTNVNVTNANLRSVDLTRGASLSGVDLSTALLCETVFPPEFGVTNSNRDCASEYLLFGSSYARLNLIPEGLRSELNSQCVHTISDGTYYCQKRCNLNSSNGSKYCGDHTEGHVFQGRGILTLPDGFTHVGEFKDGSLWTGVIYDRNGVNTARVVQGVRGE